MQINVASSVNGDSFSMVMNLKIVDKILIKNER